MKQRSLIKASIICLLVISILILGCINKNQGSHELYGNKGVVAAGNHGSSEAGAQMLKNGGNAADAAAATLLALSITDSKDFCIGGEAAVLYYNAKTKQVISISGVGEAPLDPEAISWYMRNGIPTGNIKSAPVPAVIDLCVTLLKEYGTFSFSTIAEPSLELLKKSKAEWANKLIGTLNVLIHEENIKNGDRKEKLAAVSDCFYRGTIADSLDAWYRNSGSFLRKEDLAKHVTRIEKPQVINYQGYEVYKCGPWTQGPAMLESLKLLEQFNIRDLGQQSPAYIHLLTESLKLALADRDHYYGDPLFVNTPLSALLSTEYANIRKGLISMDTACNISRPGDPYNMKAQISETNYFLSQHGTTTCCIADKWGNVVAATPSGWGSQAGSGGSTGITHSTRLLSLNTCKGHPNCIEPGKRPRITLTPTLVCKNGKPILAIAVEGGDVQDQTSLELLLDILYFGMKPTEALMMPRFTTTLLEDSFNPDSIRTNTINKERVLLINSRLDTSIVSKLTSMGHHIKLTNETIGTPAIIYIDPVTNMICGATQPGSEHYVSKY